MSIKHQAGHFDSYPEHTLFKHRLLDCYVPRWLQKVVRGRPGTVGVVIVDTFAGPGSDNQGNEGSPLLLARAAIVGRERLRHDGFSVDVQVIAIEQAPARFAKLAEFMEPFGTAVHTLSGTLREHLERILTQHSGWPMLFFFDPFGVKGLDADLVRRVLSEEGREALVLLNDPGALRLVGAAKVRRARVGKSPENLQLFEDREVEPEAISPPEIQWSRGEEISREILTAAFGDDRWEVVMKLAPGWPRRRKLIELYEGLLHEMGAAYTTRIPVWNAGRLRQYTLLHASRSPHGRTTMKEEVKRALGSCSLPDAVKEIVRTELRVNVDEVSGGIQGAFRGKEAFWAMDRRPSVQEFALQETGIFPFQLDELKRTLQRWKQPGAIVSYRLPE